MKTMRIVMTLLILVAGLSIFGCSKLTQENYEKITMGMTLDEVTAIIGEPDSCDGAMGAKKCIWGDAKKNITISFMGDKVVMPAMTGLK